MKTLDYYKSLLTKEDIEEMEIDNIFYGADDMNMSMEEYREYLKKQNESNK